MIVNAILNKDIKAYYNINDSAAVYSDEQLNQIFTDTKEITSKDFTPSTINRIILYQDFYIDKKEKKVTSDLVLVAPAIQTGNDPLKQQTLFYITPTDFFKVCKRYSITITNSDTAEQVYLDDYFTRHLYRSNILRIETTKVEYLH